MPRRAQPAEKPTRAQRGRGLVPAVHRAFFAVRGRTARRLSQARASRRASCDRMSPGRMYLAGSRFCWPHKDNPVKYLFASNNVPLRNLSGRQCKRAIRIICIPEIRSHQGCAEHRMIAGAGWRPMVPGIRGKTQAFFRLVPRSLPFTPTLELSKSVFGTGRNASSSPRAPQNPGTTTSGHPESMRKLKKENDGRDPTLAHSHRQPSDLLLVRLSNYGQGARVETRRLTSRGHRRSGTPAVMVVPRARRVDRRDFHRQIRSGRCRGVGEMQRGNSDRRLVDRTWKCLQCTVGAASTKRTSIHFPIYYHPLGVVPTLRAAVEDPPPPRAVQHPRVCL